MMSGRSGGGPLECFEEAQGNVVAQLVRRTCDDVPDLSGPL